MPWKVTSDPFGHPGLSALVAALPIFYLFWALAVKRLKGHWASLSALSVAVVISVLACGMPFRLSVLAATFGMLFGLWPICWIVITALFVYNLSSSTGEFEVIKNSLAAISDDRRMQALLIAFGFGGFIEGAAGFGTPVAITSAMLAGLGFNPLYAAGICLLANTAPVAFGGIGIPVIIASQVSGVDEFALSSMIGRQLFLVSLFIPVYMTILMSGWRKSLDAWPAAFVAGGSFAMTQWLVSNYLGPLLPSVMASLVSMVCLIVFLRFRHPKDNWHFPGEPRRLAKSELADSWGRIFRAWAPFLILSILVAAWGLKPVKALLDHYALFKFAFPGLDGMVVGQRGPVPAVFAFNLLSSAGTALFFAGLFSIPVTGTSLLKGAKIFFKTLNMLEKPVLTISAILGFAYVMNFSGMAVTLGEAFTATGTFFPFFSPFLGWIGVFMTGSDASSNALFGKLQEVTAGRIGIDPVITVGANSSGGVCGKMISPQSISVATASTGLVGHEGDIFRFTVKHSVFITACIGVLTYLQVHVLTWLVPVRKAGTWGVNVVPSAVAGSSELMTGFLYLVSALAVVAAIAVSARISGRSAPGPAEMQ